MTGRRVEPDPLKTSIARALGLESLRVGRHTLRDDRRMREGIAHVSRLWWAKICPSFHPFALLCVARTEQTEFRGKVFSPWLRGAIAIEDASVNSVAIARADIELDALWPLLKCLDLTETDETLTLDGIEYALNICGAVQTRFCFANPHTVQLRKIQIALFETASAIVRQAPQGEVTLYMTTWRGYINE